MTISSIPKTPPPFCKDIQLMLNGESGLSPLPNNNETMYPSHCWWRPQGELYGPLNKTLKKWGCFIPVIKLTSSGDRTYGIVIIDNNSVLYTCCKENRS